MDVHSSLTGPFPRPEPLVAATRDLDRGRVSAEEVDALTRRTEREILELEERLGLFPRTGGYLRWADLFRPIAEGWEGFSVGPLTRWFETNTFFRQPILHHPPGRRPGAVAPWLPAASGAVPAASAKVLLPGPYTLADVLENRSGETGEALIHRLGRLFAEEVTELRGTGYATFQFQEPSLVVHPPKGPAAESVVAAYRAIAAAAGPATTVLWTYFGDAAPVLPLLGRLGLSVVGLDLAETEVEELPRPSERLGLGLGCVDARTTLVEDPAALVELVRKLRARVDPRAIHLGPGGPLDLLPYEPATRKVHLLAAARNALGGTGA